MSSTYEVTSNTFSGPSHPAVSHTGKGERGREPGTQGGKLGFPQFNNSTDHNWPIIGARKRASAVLRGIIFWEKNKISGKVSQEGLPRLI